MDSFKEWLIQDSEKFQFILYFGLLALLLVIESVAHFREAKRGRRWVANFLLTVLAIVSMSLIPVTFVSVAAFAEQKEWGLFNIIEIHWALAGLLSLLLRGFISFFTHFLTHKVPLFWRVHRVHHLDTEMDVTTTVRFHPLEFIINSLVGIPIILALGFSIWSLMLYELIDIVITLFSHSNISLPKKLEKILRYLFVTPDLHRVHHSSYQPETDSNFSAVFPIWDILFGTFRTETRTPPDKMEIGLEEVKDDRANNIIWLLKSPFKKLKK
jgi:sterol desaturase/sphingolipid hydroxylase (fatty acid hydroxylase superfamily)